MALCGGALGVPDAILIVQRDGAVVVQVVLVGVAVRIRVQRGGGLNGLAPRRAAA
jgi:hypothetical protein